MSIYSKSDLSPNTNTLVSDWLLEHQK